MNVESHCLTYLLSLAIAMGLMSCDDQEGMTDEYFEVKNGYALSAGTSTIFNQTSHAYDLEAPWCTGSYLKRFNNGDQLYDDGPINNEGLGPVYCGYSCGSCHNNAGRTTPAAWTSSEGSGSNGMSAQLVYIASRNTGKFFQGYGRVLHDQSIYGVKAEGKLHTTKHYENFTFPDGEPYQLVYFTYDITEWYADSIKPEDLKISVRQPLRHVGQGQIMSLIPSELEALAAQSNYPEYGISGRCNYITERGRTGVGVGGNKANHLDLTVELGFSSDMGYTSTRFPEEVCAGQTQISQAAIMGYNYTKNEVSTADMEDVDLYMQCLGVPARRDVDNPTVQRGEQMFYKAKCHLCHTVTLHTKNEGTTLLNGTRLPWTGGQVIHPYSDFLLHDMGREICGVGLNDDFTAGLATGVEWRTTPLWGIGLQKLVNGHTYFLHDGRARNLVEAIMWHGGEGEASKNLFKNMPKSDRDALVRFLQSL